MSLIFTLWAYLVALFHRAWFGLWPARIKIHHERCLRQLGCHLKQFAPYENIIPDDFLAWPMTDKAAMMMRFDDYNRLGLGFDDIQALIQADQTKWQDYMIGHSTGTSGNRGVFLISRLESYQWLGTIVAKTVPTALWRPHKVALGLVAITGLYQATRVTKNIQFQGFSLKDGLNKAIEGIVAMNPDIIMGAPRLLVRLAKSLNLGGKILFSAGESLDAHDRAYLETQVKGVLREIYMATEGLLGVSCEKGVIHLCEDVMHFEYEALKGSDQIKRLVITDFTRRAQAMVRYRLNDCVILETKPCACGSPYQAIRQLIGRADDLITGKGLDGDDLMLTRI